MEEIFRGEREEAEARGTMYDGLLQRGRKLEFNFRVNLIWVGWVNFNLGGFFFIWIELIFFFWVGLFLNGCALSYPNCHFKKKYMSIKNCPRHNSVSHVYTKLTETNGRTNGASF